MNLENRSLDLALPSSLTCSSPSLKVIIPKQMSSFSHIYKTFLLPQLFFSRQLLPAESHFVPPPSQKLLHFCWKCLQAGFLHLLAPACERLLQEMKVLEKKSRLGSMVICSGPQQERTNHRWRLFTLISQEKWVFFYSTGGSSWKFRKVQRYDLFAFLALMHDPNGLAE